MKKKVLCFFIVLFCISLTFSKLPCSAVSFNPGFDTNSKAIYMGNIETDSIVYEKEPDTRIEPASTTKIMTYIVAVEHCSDLNNTMVTVTQEVTDKLAGTDSSLSNIKNGETLSLYELLNCMMVPSGNDAAMVIANYIGGNDINNFVDMMNSKAQELECYDTSFANPDGLHENNHYTTASDMYKIAKYAITLPQFMEICSQTMHTIPATNMQPERRLYTTNNMMIVSDKEHYYKYVKGIKTGWHDQSGRCIVSTASADGYTYLCVAMGAPDIVQTGFNGAMIDSKNLYKWALSTFSNKQIVTSNTPVNELDVKLSWQTDSTLVVPEHDISLLLPKDVNVSSISFTNFKVPNELNAPIKKGQVIGEVDLSYANQTLSTITLVASEDIKRSEILYFFKTLSDIFKSPWLLLIIGIFLLILISYTFIVRSYRRKNKYNRSVKKYRRF